jgi:hypothetical protein
MAYDSFLDVMALSQTYGTHKFPALSVRLNTRAAISFRTKDKSLEFEPIVGTPAVMDPRLFGPEIMGLKDEMLSMSLTDRIGRSKCATKLNG